VVNKFLRVLLAASVALMFMSGCARDLSSSVYTSDSTLSLTLEGVVISARPVTIKNKDKLEANSTGMVAGGMLGATTGGNGGDMIAGMVAGAAIGALVEGQLGVSEGFEYIVKLDTSKLKSDYYEGSASMRNAISTATTSGIVTIVQGKENVLTQGQKVYVIFSEKSTRVIAASPSIAK
jgi:outer membrane lipoprotein SlyB